MTVKKETVIRILLPEVHGPDGLFWVLNDNGHAENMIVAYLNFGYEDGLGMWHEIEAGTPRVRAFTFRAAG